MEIIDWKIRGKKEVMRFDSFCYDSLLKQRKGTSKILLHKRIVTDLGLQPDTKIWCHLAGDSRGRPVMICYLDGGPRVKVEEGDKSEESG